MKNDSCTFKEQAVAYFKSFPQKCHTNPIKTIYLQSNFMNQTHYNAKNDGILAERY